MQIIKKSDPASIELACKFLREGKVISFACDTVYGIAADASNFKAVEAIYRIKNRDQKKPLAIFLSNLTAAEKIFFFDDLAKKISKKNLPGALTLILPTKPEALQMLASNLNSNQDGFLGFRIIDDEFVKNLLEKFGGILAVTSANLSNQSDAICADEVAKCLTGSELALIVDGGICKEKIPSTVAKIAQKKLTILRRGPVDLNEFENT